MSRVIEIGEALDIIRSVYATFGWRPDAGSTREQRNAWFASAVAVVHYGHPALNPAGGDPRWCIKDAGGGRPQSDDIIVDRHTREYFDLMPNAGATGWSWNIGRHSEPLPAEQNVYPPSRASLPAVPEPSPDPTPEPVPPVVTPPSGPSDVERLILEAVGHLHAKLDAVRAENAALRQQVSDLHAFVDANTAKIGIWMTEQAQGAVSGIVGALGPKIDDVKDAQCVLKRR